MSNRCIICHIKIANTVDGRFCHTHRRFAELWSAVAAGACSDWDRNLGGLVSHKEMQLEPACEASHSWLIDVGDINRLAHYWLDGWNDESGAAA